MKRIALSAIAAVALLSAGSAFAAPQHGPQHPEARPSHNSWDKPQARKGQSWNKHVRACKAKYRSYSPQRDAYRSNRGDWVRCRV